MAQGLLTAGGHTEKMHLKGVFSRCCGVTEEEVGRVKVLDPNQAR
jgi:hypothetical protein